MFIAVSCSNGSDYKDYQEETNFSQITSEEPSNNESNSQNKNTEKTSSNENNSNGFVYIKGGTVSKNVGKEGCPFYNASETPVTIESFYIAEIETTYKKWLEVYEWATSDERGEEKYTLNEGWQGNYGDKSNGTPLMPVTFLSWRDAIVWCNAASEMDKLEPVYLISETDNIPVRQAETSTVASGLGKAEKAYVNKSANGYRLPTKAEWEYAARGGNPNIESWNYDYSGTNNIEELIDYADCIVSNLKNIVTNTAEVKSKKPNYAGLYDMSGNVWEWCYDKYSTTERIFRGGGWIYSANFCTVDYRGYVDNLKNSSADAVTIIDLYQVYGKSSDVGFRVVRNANK